MVKESRYWSWVPVLQRGKLRSLNEEWRKRPEPNWARGLIVGALVVGP